MVDHIIKATDEDETGMDYIRTIDGDKSNDDLVQRVMEGHFKDWNKMVKVVGDRELIEKVVKAAPEIKAQMIVILDAAIEAIRIEEIIP